MKNKNYILEESVLLVLSDGNEHEFTVKCFDGYAECTPVDNADKPVRLEYPLLDSVVNDYDKTLAVLRYRGLSDCDAEDITYGDIMMCYGEIKA